MKRYKDRLINNKTLPPHNFITLELVRRKFISSDSDFDLYLFDSLFEELLLRYEFKTIIVAANYIVTKVKKQGFLSENGEKIENVFAYFSASLRFNLKKITGELYIDWLDDD